MKIAFSWDDGALEDKKLFELHSRYQIPAIFFIPTSNREGRPVLSTQDLRDARSRYVSFGGHTSSHSYLTDIPFDYVEEEVRSNKVFLEEVLGYEIEHFCLPGGRYNKRIIETIYNVGYKTIRSADIMNFKESHRLIRPSIQIYNRGIKSLIAHSILERSTEEFFYCLANTKENFFELIEGLLAIEAKKESAYVLFWGHSWEIEENGLWGNLENLLRVLSDHYLDACIPYDSFVNKD